MNYQQTKTLVEQRIAENKKRQRFLSWIRALLFLGMIGAVVLATGIAPHFWWLFIGLLAAFLRVVVLHQKKRDHAVFLQHRLDIVRFELGEAPSPFAQAKKDTRYSHVALDLDLFVETGVFERLNRSVSPQGADFLAQTMQEPFYDVEIISSEQEVTREWQQHMPLIHDIMAEGLAAVNQYGQSPELHNPKFKPAAWLPWALTTLGLGALIGQFFGWHYYWLVGVFFGNLIVISRFKKETLQIGKQLAGQEALFSAYSKVFKHINNTSFQHKKLRDLEALAQHAGVGLRQLAKITNSFEQLFNLFVQAILNGLLGYELHVLSRYKKWHKEYATSLVNWIAAIKHLDYWNSLAIWALNHPSFSHPEVSESFDGITAATLGHPLLPEKTRVSNPAHFSTAKNRVNLVTGSNMSGKSTYLRSIGINIILARMGAVVCGSQVKLAPMRLLTCIRVTDSVTEGASFFYAELQRLKDIRETLSDQQPTVILLDEILRGTNSEDKYLGSKRFAEALLQYCCIAVMATHDLKLSELEQQYPNSIQNLAFESDITNNALRFDYKLRYAVARNRNATYLMEKMGVIDQQH
ncbi:MAG: hypothetical protein LAT76_05925 [Schleiferiaceae bacterium]|nr:hypothetical protein [Schleiferiaceae bacterium]